MNTVPTRLSHLREAMATHQLDAYFVPSGDPHQSEYVAPRWETRAWLSGFTGSAGTLVVTPDFAGLWTDSRYFLQGETQLAGTGVALQRQKVPHAPEHLDWLAAQLPHKGRLGFDGRVVSLSTARSLQKKLKAKAVTLVAEHDLPEAFWEDRPALPAKPVTDFPVQYAGEDRKDKLARLRTWLTQQQADALLLVALDDIAWTLNVRGQDVDFNPVCLSYLLITADSATWFVGEERVDAALRADLQKVNVKLAAYAAIETALLHFPQDKCLAISPTQLSYYHYGLLDGKQLMETGSPVTAMKTIKNETEIEHFRKVMAKDGVALLRLFRWLDQQLRGDKKVTEVQIAEQLAGYRAELPLYQGESFPAIVGYRGNGAIVHYRAEHDSCATLQNNGILLLDSGGQYLDGTTDITRTVALGTPTMEEREHFTLVLKGMIALSRARFPKGTGGAQLDTLARQFLWQQGLNFGHGTGHGVGFFLNVHEGPQGFATSAVTSRGRTSFEPGMVTSNEPGFYRTDHYGIRIENLILCVEDQRTDYGEFLRFETLTLFPIDRQLTMIGMLSAEEQKWLNQYHQQVLDNMLPLLNDDAERQWLRYQCQPM